MKPVYKKPRRLQFTLMLALTALLAGLVGCSQGGMVVPAGVEPALHAQGTYPPYLTRYTLGDRDAGKKTLLSRERGFCWLSGIGGKVNDNMAGVVTTGSSQMLFRHAANTYVAAHCLEWGALKTSKANTVKWLSPTFTAVTPAPPPKCPTGVQPAWWGTSATFLTTLGGDWTTHKIAFVDESSAGFTSSRVIASGCEPSSFALVSATSMFFGVPKTGVLPRYYGPQSSSAVREKAGSYGVKASNSLEHKVLAPADKAFCYLQSIVGQFDNDADMVDLYVGGNNWILLVNHTGGADSLIAQAYCYRLTQ